MFAKLNPFRSIAGRLTFRVTATILVIFTIITAVIFAFVWILGVGAGMYYYKQEINSSNDKISNILLSVESAVANNRLEVEENINDPDKMFSMTEHILEQNNDIVGSAVAFKPNFYPQKGRQFAPYAYRQDSLIQTKQLGSDTYDYHHMDWYEEPMEEGKGYWSNPYLDKGGGEIPMTTYSIPLTDKKGNRCGVLTADFALDWLSNLIKEEDYDDFLDTYCFIVGRDGTFIAHPNKELILKETVQEYCKKTDGAEDDSVAVKILAGERGTKSIKVNGAQHFISYAPIERTGWAMCIVVPIDNLFEIGYVLGAIVAIIMLMGVFIMSVVCYLNIRSVTKPISRFAYTADQIAKGNILAILPQVKSKDEMLRLRNSFATMQRSLIRQIEETKQINEQKGRMESELQIARDIQMTMLPKTFPPFPDRSDIDVYAQLKPAKEVGGDLYDFFVRDEKLFFCIGDVSGKGVPASLVMAVTMALFRTLSSHEANPERIISRLNNTISEGNDSEMFVTLFLGVLDLPTGRLRYANAGHNAPLLIESEGKKVTMLDVNPNLPVGIMHDWKYIAQEKLIEPNSAIFLYTDGLTEAENINQQLFGEKRLIDVIQQVESTLQPHTFIEHIFENVKQFVGEADQSDDLTMMAVRYSKEQQAFSLERSIELTNDIKQVSQLTAFVDEVCEIVGVDMSTTMSLNLALEEAVVNVMDYGYPAGQVGHIEVKALANEMTLTFVISDDGIPFDPTAKSEVDTTLSVEQRPIGGLGIHLVRTIMDSINYERTRGRNILTLRKKL
jgi:sigma-B regulation protein RsbU (phosphoserine phosphatase)